MDFQQQKAIYLQIADMLCEKILRREWQANEKIPSVREMAVNIEVNPNTVVRTYGYLEEQGIIYKQRGIGYFVAEKAYENTVHLKKDIFINQELPLFFKTMRLLNLSFADLRGVYENEQ